MTKTKRNSKQTTTPAPAPQVTPVNEPTHMEGDDTQHVIDTQLAAETPTEQKPEPPAPPAPPTKESGPMDALRERARQLATVPRKSAAKTCLCGCGGTTKGGNWIPGHNGRKFAEILAEERAKLAAEKAEPTGPVQ